MLIGKYLISEVGNYIRIDAVIGEDSNESNKRIYENYKIKYCYLDKKWGDIKYSNASYYSIENRLREGYVKYVDKDEVPLKLIECQYSI
jgi:hypothetical protein